MHVSAVKRNENGTGWIVRLFNKLDKAVEGLIRLNGGASAPVTAQSPVERVRAEFDLPGEERYPWGKIRTVTLEEIPEKDLSMDENGWAPFIITGKKILTIEFLP